MSELSDADRGHSVGWRQPVAGVPFELTARERAILNSLAHGVVAIDLRDQITLFNAAAEHMFGYRATEVLGHNPTLLYAAESLARMHQAIHARNLPFDMSGLIALTSSPMSDWTYLRKDGTTLPGRLSITELRNEQGQVFGYLGLITDLTDRARVAEMEAREQALIAHISRGTNAAVGEQFFNQLVDELRLATGADFTDIFVRLPELGGLRGTLRNAPAGEALSGLLDFTGTPFEPLVRDGSPLHLLGVKDQFTELTDAGTLGIDELIGVPLISSTGAVLGALFAAHREHLPEPELAQHLLEIFAVRASSELERMQAEQALQQREAAQRWLYAASEHIHSQRDVAGVAHEAVTAIVRHQSRPLVTMSLNKPDGYHVLDYAGPPERAPHLTIYPHQPDLLRIVLKTGRSIVLLPDYLDRIAGTEFAAEAAARDMRAAVLVVLIERDQLIGTMTLGYSDPAALATLDLDTLTMFGRTVALALTRALHRQEIEYQAEHDGLTGLFNRSVLHREFERWRGDGGAQTALLLLDLDRFKEVNDTFGHHVGDALLRQIGDRLRSGIHHSQATLTRLGGDEFAVLLGDKNTDAERASALAENMLSALQQPFMVNGVNLEIGASVGVALYPDHGDDSHALLRSADVAMYEAKRSGGGVALYNRDLDFNSPERLALITDLGTGIRERELELFYQPKLDLRSGRVVGLEALLRWRHPRLGLLTPDRFLPLAEMSDAIHSLTALVLDMACAQLHNWLAAGAETTLAVNLSARNLIDDRVVRQLSGLLHAYQIPGGRLELEITETALIHDPDYARHLLERIAALGVRLSIDDFGTGYSSLAHLRQMPISTLKIDRTFIRDMLTNPQDQLIVRSIIQLAHNLELSVIAEGVESAAVLTQLTEMGCDQAQGYYFTRPLPAAELQHWLATATGAGTPSAGRQLSA